MHRKLLPVLLLSCLATAAAADAPGDRWIHVRVIEDGEATVSMNLPLAAAVDLVPLAQPRALSGGKLTLDEREGVDVVALLRELLASPDTEFLTVRDEEETVRITKDAGFLRIEADEGEGGEKVLARLPMEVVEALLSDTAGSELNVAAGLEALGRFANGDLVTVEGGETRVRIWVDSSEYGR